VADIRYHIIVFHRGGKKGSRNSNDEKKKGESERGKAVMHTRAARKRERASSPTTRQSTAHLKTHARSQVRQNGSHPPPPPVVVRGGNHRAAAAQGTAELRDAVSQLPPRVTIRGPRPRPRPPPLPPHPTEERQEGLGYLDHRRSRRRRAVVERAYLPSEEHRRHRPASVVAFAAIVAAAIAESADVGGRGGGGGGEEEEEDRRQAEQAIGTADRAVCRLGGTTVPGVGRQHGLEELDRERHPFLPDFPGRERSWRLCFLLLLSMGIMIRGRAGKAGSFRGDMNNAIVMPSSQQHHQCNASITLFLARVHKFVSRQNPLGLILRQIKNSYIRAHRTRPPAR
jgi:hypothetical protein